MSILIYYHTVTSPLYDTIIVLYSYAILLSYYSINILLDIGCIGYRVDIWIREAYPY